MSGPNITARTIREDEYEAWERVNAAAFGGFPDSERFEIERRLLPLERTIAAFAGDELVGSTGDYPFEMTVCGGGIVPVAGVTAVGVLGTHRRRGALRAMMLKQFEDTANRGEVAAVLNASESNIYGRFGYGLAQEYQTVQIRTSRAEFTPPPPERSLHLVPKDEAIDRLRLIFDAYRSSRAGEVSRSIDWWNAMLGDVPSWRGGGPVFVVVAGPDGPDPGGYAIYELQNQGPGIIKRMVVRELIAAAPQTEAALWRYCIDLDLVGVVEMTARPLDDPIRWRLAEPRQLEVVRQADYLWVRLLDIPRALEARCYGADGEIVLDVRDELLPRLAGRYRLEGSPKGGGCARTNEDADLELTAADLGALYLGGMKASALAEAGRIIERQPGALERADALFGWRSLPHCSTRF